MSKAEQKRLRHRFLDWQCRIRQAAMRGDEGRPSPGMRPRLLDAGGQELMPALTVLLVPKVRVQRVDIEPSQLFPFIVSGGIAGASGAPDVDNAQSLQWPLGWRKR